jgi:hypothetical protein
MILIVSYAVAFLNISTCYAEISKEEALKLAKDFFNAKLTAEWGPIEKATFTIGDKVVHNLETGIDGWEVSFEDNKEKRYLDGGLILIDKDSGRARFVGYAK